MTQSRLPIKGNLLQTRVPLLTVTFGLITAPPVSLTTALIASPRRDITPQSKHRRPLISPISFHPFLNYANSFPH